LVRSDTIDSKDSEEPKYTRVTEILYPFSGLQTIPEHIVMNAAERGTKVHNICESIMKGLGDWGVDEETKPYVDSFNKWWSLGHKVLSIEQRFFCSELMITGQVDMILETDNGAVILDLKTSSKPSKTWPLQGSAYAYMAKQAGYDIKGIHFLHLSRLGNEPTLHVYDDQFELFKKCRDVYKHFFEKPNGRKITRIRPEEPSKNVA